MKLFTSVQENRPAGRVSGMIFLLLVSIQSVALATGNDNGMSPAAITGKKALPPIVWTPLKGYYSMGISYLSWSSLQESNSSHFDVQRSTDGVNYISAGKVMAQTVSDKVVVYGFNDMKAEDGMNYYRIQYFDNDGHFQYSNTILVNVLIRGINITSVYPGPFTDKINVNIASEGRTGARVELFDNSGKILANRQYALGKGVSTLCVDNLEGLTKGIYIIRIKAGESVVTRTIIK